MEQEQHWGVVVEEAQGQTLHQKEEIEDEHKFSHQTDTGENFRTLY